MKLLENEAILLLKNDDCFLQDAEREKWKQKMAANVAKEEKKSKR